MANMLKTVLFSLLVLYSGVISYDIEANVENIKYEATVEDPRVETADTKPEDPVLPSTTPNEDTDPEQAIPQTEAKKQELHLSPKQIDALADKILKIHGIEPKEKPSQNDVKVKRLLNVVASVETNLENKLKEVREEKLKQLEEKGNIGVGDDIKLEDITKVLAEGLNEEINTEQKEDITDRLEGIQTNLPETENRGDETAPQTQPDDELRREVYSLDEDKIVAEENLNDKEENTAESVAEDIATETNEDVANVERDTEDIADEADENIAKTDAEDVAVDVDESITERTAEGVAVEVENADDVSAEANLRRDAEHFVKLGVETIVEAENAKQPNEENKDEVVVDTIINEQILVEEINTEEVTNIQAEIEAEEKVEETQTETDLKIEENTVEESVIENKEEILEDKILETQEDEGGIENLKITPTITVDQSIVNEENEIDQSDEAEDVTNTETCNAEEADCNQGSKKYLYSVEDNLKVVHEEEKLESKTENGYFRKLFNFIYDRF